MIWRSREVIVESRKLRLLFGSPPSLFCVVCCSFHRRQLGNSFISWDLGEIVESFELRIKQCVRPGASPSFCHEYQKKGLTDANRVKNIKTKDLRDCAPACARSAFCGA